MRCGLVGTRQWVSSALLPALLAQPGTEVVGCVAATFDEARGFAETHGAGRAFPEIGDLISDGRPELAIVATPDHVHASAVEALLAAGVAVYCEKPLANDAETAWSLAALGGRAGAAATVGFSFRFNPAIQALRRDLASGRLGTPWLIELAEHNPQFHPHGGRPMNWKGDPDQAAGGALFEYGSHVIDMAAWLAGPVTRVSSSLQRVLPGARLDDIATLQMEFAGGARGLLVSSWVLTGGFPGIRIRLHGSEAFAEVWVDDRLPGGQRYVVTPAFGPGGGDVALEPMGDYRSDAARRHLADFIADVRGDLPRHPKTLPSLAEAAHVQDVLSAALLATREWRDVSERTQHHHQ